MTNQDTKGDFQKASKKRSKEKWAQGGEDKGDQENGERDEEMMTGDTREG